MSHAAAVLSHALTDLGLSQTELAAKAGVNLGLFNRYTRGHASVGADNLLKLCAALPEPQSSELVAAYLDDALPPSLAQKVLIMANGSAKISEQEEIADRVAAALKSMDPELRKDVLFLVELAGRQTPIGDIFRQSADILRGTVQTQSQSQSQGS